MTAVGNSYSVQGKTAIVTGAGSGINLCFASLLLSKGCNVLFADIALRPEAEEIIKKHSSGSPRAHFQKTDVTSWTQLSQMFQVGQDTFGNIDIVCPGAGVYEPSWSNFWHPPGSSKSKDAIDGDRYASIDINVSHPIRVSQLAIAHFLSEDNGAKASPDNPKRIVHISSIAGEGANLATPLYIASKWAVIGFTRSLAPLEERLGIRVNAVAPGVIKTPLWTEHPEKMIYLDEEKDEWATPEEVAEAMLDLVVNPEMPGGTILEVGQQSRRKIPLFNNPGPSGPGLKASNAGDGEEEVFRWLAAEDWGKAN